MYNFSYLKLKIYFLCYKYLVSVVFVCDLEGASAIIELKENKKKNRFCLCSFFDCGRKERRENTTVILFIL